jgi:Transposase
MQYNEHFHGCWNRVGFPRRAVCDSLSLLIRRGIAMGKAYSQDLRERVMAAVESGTGAYAAASIFQVSVSYIYKALGRRRATGETSARPWAGGPKPKLAAHDEALRARVMNQPDATLAERIHPVRTALFSGRDLGSMWP